MWENPLIAISAISLVLNISGTLAAVAWKMSRVELNMKLALREALDENTKEIEDRIDRHVRYFGETVMAVRQKITDVEIFARDHFVRKDENQSQLQQLLQAISKLESKIDSHKEG